MPTTITRPTPAYPRPPLTFLHSELFREPVYEDGQAYPRPDDEDDGDDEPTIITP